MRRFDRPHVVVFVFFALVALLAVVPATATTTDTVTRTFEVGANGVVMLENLAGRVVVTRGGGSVTLTATIHAGSRELLDSLDIRSDKSGGATNIVAYYPTDRYRDFVYAPLEGKGWGGRTQVKYLERKVRIFSSPRRGAAELWVDMELQVPAGVHVKVRNRVGRIEATNISGDLDLDSASGDVVARDNDGKLRADTGSGDVKVENHRGDVLADTGSGDVALYDIAGDIDADTGSGDVDLRQIDATRILADTGSGDVRLENCRGALLVDTGSGEVSGTDVTVVGDLEIDTGSGGVDLRGDLSGLSRALIDTGSGGVTLESRSFPGMNLDISTGSGRINLDLDSLNSRVSERDRFVGTSGGGGVSVEIDTGSGGVRIIQR